MTEYDPTNAAPNPYVVPDEILNGEFRAQIGDPDPSFEYAMSLVSSRLGEKPDITIVHEVYREVARARAAFEDIRSKEDPSLPVNAEPYFIVSSLFGNRIEQILTGEILE